MELVYVFYQNFKKLNKNYFAGGLREGNRWFEGWINPKKLL